MKVCEICGTEIFTQDGENCCSVCDGVQAQEENQKKHNQRLKKARQQRKAYAEAMSSLGLVKVKGAMGGTYWE